ncbi:uncharacterized protein ACMZJ9_018721 [Mantella aurantiaca]
MTFLFAILHVFWALESSVNSLSCMECTSTITTSCTGPTITCPSGSVCGVTYISTREGNTRRTTYAMTCTSESQCFKSGGASFPLGREMKIGTSCCNTHKCIPTLPSLPVNNSVSNGVTCPSCESVDPNRCAMQCTGDENACLHQTVYTGEVVRETKTFYGCTTKSICDLGNLCYSVIGIPIEIQFNCTSGSTTGLQTHLYIPSVICLLFLKLLFLT